MSLTPGTRLGVYEVTAKIGAGILGKNTFDRGVIRL